MKKVLVFILFFAFFAFSETLVLQDGLDGYSGTDDVTIFSDTKAEAYTWFVQGGQQGHPDDKLLINTEFCCWGTGPRHEGRALISFDLSKIPEKAKINSAKLEIKHSSFASSPSAYRDRGSIYETDGSLLIHKVTKEWTENQLSNAQSSYRNYKSSISSSAEDTFEYKANTTSIATFDVTKAISDMYSKTIDNNGFMIITDSPRADQAANSDWWGGLWTYWYSSENTSKKDRPKLTIEYTIENVSISTNSLTKLNTVKAFFVKNVLNLNLDNSLSKTEISLYNITGRQVFKAVKNLHEGRNTLLIGNHLSKGSYILKISNSNLNIVKNLLIR